MDKQLENVSHEYIRYANCWEDADLLLEGLNAKPGGRFLSIGSAGDNSFSLLSTGAEIVVAVDINPVQLQLVEFKKAAIKALEHQEYLELMGFESSTRRQELFEKTLITAPEKTASFWKNREAEVMEGLIYKGKFENYFKLFSKRILPLIHTKKRIKELFRDKPVEEQKTFYEKRWNNWRWRLMFKLFFSKFIMGRFGRDPAFLKEVEVPVSTSIFGHAAHHLSSTGCQTNYFLHFIMKGNFGDQLPHYVRSGNYEKIRENIDKIVVFEGLAEKAFEQYKDFNYFNLSNIFEYMDSGLFGSVVQNFADNSAPGARFAYWNLLVPRLFENANAELFEFQRELSDELTSRDNGFFYQRLVIDQRK
jgi:S-adenosylmethionine-diacylglycerol 3-amino-3-carboxypropyl transferase